MSELELVDRKGEEVRKGRISPALRTAITLIVHEGLTVAQAAAKTGYQAESLAKALLKPHVRVFRADVKRAWLASETERAYLTAADLMTRSGSDDVRLKAAKVFIEMDQEARRTMPNEARQLVQIVTQNLTMHAVPPTERSAGVIEAKPFQPLSLPSSNFIEVGQGESDDDDA